MSEQKHTAGNWRVRVGEFPVGHPGRIIVSSPSRCVCKIHQPDRAKAMADAHLIAAAPRLLAALQPFAAFACDPPCGCYNCIARHAIAKATEVTP